MTDELTPLIRIQGTINRNLTCFYNFAKGSLTIAEKQKLKLRLKNNCELISKFEEIQYDIDVLENDDSESYAERLSFEGAFYSALAFAKFLLNSNMICSISNMSNTPKKFSTAYTNNVKLPVIELPKFNGNLAKWFEFKDTYMNVHH